MWDVNVNTLRFSVSPSRPYSGIDIMPAISRYPRGLRLAFAGIFAWALGAAGAALAQSPGDESSPPSEHDPIRLGIIAVEGSAAAAQIIGADLASTALFEISTIKQSIDDERGTVDSLRSTGLDYVLLLEAQPDANSESRLWELRKPFKLAHFRLAGTAKPRLHAHQIADTVFQKLTGRRSGFDTRLATVLKLDDGQHILKVADADGANPINILTSLERVGAPSWSADSQLIAFVSWETYSPQLFVQDLARGQRQPVLTTIDTQPAFPMFLAEQTLVWAEIGAASTQVRMAVKGRLQQPALLGELASPPIALLKKPGENLVWAVCEKGIWSMDPLNRDAPPVQIHLATGRLIAAATCEAERLLLLQEIDAEGNFNSQFAATAHGLRLSRELLPRQADIAGNPAFNAACTGLLLPVRDAQSTKLLGISADGSVRHEIKSAAASIIAAAYSPHRVQASSVGGK